MWSEERSHGYPRLSRERFPVQTKPVRAFYCDRLTQANAPWQLIYILLVFGALCEVICDRPCCFQRHRFTIIIEKGDDHNGKLSATCDTKRQTRFAQKKNKSNIFNYEIIAIVSASTHYLAPTACTCLPPIVRAPQLFTFTSTFLVQILTCESHPPCMMTCRRTVYRLLIDPAKRRPASCAGGRNGLANKSTSGYTGGGGDELHDHQEGGFGMGKRPGMLVPVRHEMGWPLPLPAEWMRLSETTTTTRRRRTDHGLFSVAFDDQAGWAGFC